MKRIFSLILCLTLLSGFAVFAQTPEDDRVEIIVPKLDNAVEVSPGIKYDEIDAILNDDYTHALVYAKEEKQPAYAIYKSEKPFRSFAVEHYIGRWARVDVRFYVSKDGEDWKFASIQLYNLSKTKHNDVYEATQQYHRIYKGDHLEDEYNYLKIEFPARYGMNIVKLHFCADDVYEINTNGRVAHSQKALFDHSTITPLKEAFKDYFDIGVSVEPWDLNAYEQLLDTHFDVITTENQFKGHVVQQGPDTWYFDGTDQVVNWAVDHGKEARGHALWYHGNHYATFFKDEKGQLVDKEEALRRMEKHVKAKVSRYKGKFQYYDVCNEIFDPGSGNLKSYMTEAQICGQDYIPYLFKWAKEVDPDAVLLYNDNSHLIPAMRKGIVTEIKKWLDDGVPIDAIGLQWHESVFSDPDEMRDLFRMLRELGLPVYITEMDMTAYPLFDTATVHKWENREKVADAVARAYATTFDIFRENADIIECVSFWCPTDNRSSVTQPHRYDFPLPFDMDGNPSLNYYAIIDEEGKMPRLTEDVWDWPELAKNYPDGYEPQFEPVYQGTPVIDGEIDDVWAKAEPFPLEKYCVGKNGATGTVKVLWDNERLYVLGEVKDDTPDATGDGGWNRDNMEIFVSQSNMHVSWMGGGDRQYRIDPSGEIQAFENAVCVPLKDGYRYEASLVLETVKPYAGVVYSFEAGFADAREGTIHSISKWCDVTNNSYQATELWGDIILTDGTIEIPEKVSQKKTIPTEAELTGTYAKDAFYFKEEKKDVPIVIENGVSMIGMRDFLKMTGISVKTDKSGAIELYTAGQTVQMKMNDMNGYINQAATTLPNAPVVVDGKTRLPLRFVFESFGYTVAWDNEAAAILVN